MGSCRKKCIFASDFTWRIDRVGSVLYVFIFETMKNQRFEALGIMHSRPDAKPVETSKRKSEIFGQDVFTRSQMRRYLSKSVYDSVKIGRAHV